MRIRFLSIMAFLLIPCMAGAYTITDYIHNSSGVAISGVYVRAYERFTIRYLTADTTDANGRYDLTISDDVTLLTVCASNYLAAAPSLSRCWEMTKANAGSWTVPNSLGIRGLASDSSTVGISKTGSLDVTVSRPRLFGIDTGNKGTVNLNNPKVVSLFFMGGFHWQYFAAESLWLDGFRAAIAPSLDSIGRPNYVTWDEIRETQNMGHEIWLWGGRASLTVGGPKRWANYTTAQLDTALSNAKAAFATQGIRLSGFKWPEGDSASFVKFRSTIAKHFDAGIFNTGWNPARPYGAGISLVDSVSVFNLGDILASYPVTWLASAESVIAYYTGENSWVLLEIYGSPVPGYSAIQCGPDPRLLWQWTDSVGIQILPPAQVAKQWYGLGWPTDWNPISNGDFSQDLDVDGRPDGWYCVDTIGTCANIVPEKISKNGPHGPTPEGHRNYATIQPYVWQTGLRGQFTGFAKQRNYAFSFWARNDSDDDTTSAIRMDIFRVGASGQLIGDDTGRWGYIAPTLPSDTLWHKIDYTIDPDLIVATGDSLQAVLLFVLGAGDDTVYVTGFEAHLFNDDIQNGLDRALVPINTNLFFSADYDSIYAITPGGVVKKGIVLE